MCQDHIVIWYWRVTDIYALELSIVTWMSFPYMLFDRHQIDPNQCTEYRNPRGFHSNNLLAHSTPQRFHQRFHESTNHAPRKRYLKRVKVCVCKFTPLSLYNELWPKELFFKYLWQIPSATPSRHIYGLIQCSNTRFFLSLLVIRRGGNNFLVELP